ncbi:MAG: hypothetical protein IKW96_03880 [Ruminococcus sp.]|uniref:hypothetical protein n=1 Tax=Ruminococcus sp. TaxID=41978 RepID=UPI0025D57ED8|nr:hypothetical protein [Ruminococcus sp.]MBR5682409.1 hypothetical protein [Ruminococcus sp.]
MAWNPKKPGNYAWLTQIVKEHGGVEQFIDDIHNEGYQKGQEHGVLIGASIATIAFVAVLGAYQEIRHIVEVRKASKVRAKVSSDIIRCNISKSDSEGVDTPTQK